MLSKEADELINGEIELDERYFGGTSQKQTLLYLDILKRQGKVYTVVVDETKADMLIPIIKHKIKPDSLIYTNSYRSSCIMCERFSSILKLIIRLSLLKV